MNKRELAKDFYKILEECRGCPKEVYCKILEEDYEDEELNYMCRLLYRWNEWLKLEGLGGRIYYNYWKVLEKSV